MTDARVQREFIPRRVPNCDPSTPRVPRRTRLSVLFQFFHRFEPEVKKSLGDDIYF